MLNRRHEKTNGDAMLEMARYVVGSRLVANTAVAGIVLWGAYRVASGSLELGVLAASVLYLRRLYDPIDRLGMFLNSYQSAAASLEKIAGLLAQTPVGAGAVRAARRCPRSPAEHRAATSSSTGSASPTAPAARCCRVLDLPLPAGQTVAVVGATGAGKSTLAKLLARFYDPTQGRVLLDGVDLRELSVPELRRGVVMVTQEAFLFSGTVAENIAIGRPDATREEIEQAAKAIGAHDFISALPDGYDTDVRKRGGRISAGQRQLVAFARALLADPAVLILDEATSSLDVPGERAVQRAMSTVLRGPDRGGHRAPAVHGGDRRPGAGDGARADRRGRHRRPNSSPAPAGSPICTAPGGTASSEERGPRPGTARAPTPTPHTTNRRAHPTRTRRPDAGDRAAGAGGLGAGHRDVRSLSPGSARRMTGRRPPGHRVQKRQTPRHRGPG